MVDFTEAVSDIQKEDPLLSALQEAGDTFFEIRGLNLGVCSPEGSLTAILSPTLRNISVSFKRNLIDNFQVYGAFQKSFALVTGETESFSVALVAKLLTSKEREKGVLKAAPKLS